MSNINKAKKILSAITFNKNNLKKLKFDKLIIRCNGENAYKKFFEVLGLNKDDYRDHEEKPFTEEEACQLLRYDKYPQFNYIKDRWATLHIKLGDDNDIIEFNKKFKDAGFDFGIQEKTKSLWFPDRPILKTNQQYWQEKEPFKIKAKYPIYVISKGRYKKMLTADALLEMKQPFNLVVEESEYELYKEELKKKVDNPNEYLLMFSNKDKNYFTSNIYKDDGGSIPVRNFIWQHSKKAGHKRHWCLDDNLDGFYRLQNNGRVKLLSSVGFRVCERWTDDFENVYMSGLNYLSFMPEISRRRKQVQKNTRIYSCILLHNDANKFIKDKPLYLWRGRYNEDTDLSLRLLKSGHPTMLLNNFVCNKQTTMSCKGGNTDSIYKGDGLQKKLDSLILQHPDVAKGTNKFKKVHHQVDYKPFEKNEFKLSSKKLTHHKDRNYNLVLKSYEGLKVVKKMNKKKDYILEKKEETPKQKERKENYKEEDDNLKLYENGTLEMNESKYKLLHKRYNETYEFNDDDLDDLNKRLKKLNEKKEEPKEENKLNDIMDYIKSKDLTEEEKKKLICCIAMM
jgi:hypothetical protein